MVAVIAINFFLAAFAYAQNVVTGPLVVTPTATDGGQVCLREISGSDSICIAGPGSTSGYTVTMPSADGVGALTSDGAGNLSWSSGGSSPPFPDQTKIMSLDGTSSVSHIWELAGSSATASTQLILRKASGTTTSPATIATGEILGSLGFYGHNGSSYNGLAFLQVEAEAVNSGAFRFLTVSGGGFGNERWRIDKDGHFFPGGDKTTDVGKSGRALRDLWTEDTYTETLKHPSLLPVRVSGGLNPSSAYGYSLGESGIPWDTLWVGDTEISGIDGVGSGGFRFSGGNLQWSHDRSAWNNFVTGGVTSVSGTSPISASPTTGAVTVSCSTCVTTDTGQTISGAKTFSSPVNLTGSPALRISGTTVIDASRNFINIVDLRFTGQLWGPYTADTTVNTSTSAGKVAYYDSSGVFKGWIVVFP